MKLSYNWLNDFADFKSVGFETILEKINLSICEVDDVSEYRKHLSTIVSAKVVEVNKHPDAVKLSVCVADVETKKIQIVTGAQVAVGEIVPLAMIGTVFPDGKEIKEGKILKSPLELPEAQFEKLERHQAMTDFCHTSLRMLSGLDMNSVAKKFNATQALKIQNRCLSILEKGWLEKTETGFKLTPEGVVISNQVFLELTFLKEELT